MCLLEGGRYVENRLQFRQLAVMCTGADLVYNDDEHGLTLTLTLY